MESVSTHSQALDEQLAKFRRAVDADRFDVTVRELVRMGTTGELHRAPVYQRKFRWDEDRESTLIESIFLGLPVPSIFVATNKDGVWELVDGLQRISTLLHYVADDPQALKEIGKEASLRLRGMEKLKLFNGKTFAELPTSLQLHFYKRGLSVTALSDKSDLDVRFDVFERLNRGGIALTAQEVRACIYQGPFNKLIRELATSPDFETLIKLKRKQFHDGTKEEVVLKFFAYFHDRDNFKGEVTNFLTDYMKRCHEKPTSFDRAKGKALFLKVTAALAEGIGGPVLRTGTYVTPINQLEALLVGGADVIRSKGQIRVPKGKAWLDDQQLVAASTKGTNTPSALRERIDRAAVLLAKASKG
jgi:hypothetical protein